MKELVSQEITAAEHSRSLLASCRGSGRLSDRVETEDEVQPGQKLRLFFDRCSAHFSLFVGKQLDVSG